MSSIDSFFLKRFLLIRHSGYDTFCFSTNASREVGGDTCSCYSCMQSDELTAVFYNTTSIDRIEIYPIICLKSVCLSGDVRKVQIAIIGRLPREMSQTDRILSRYFLSRVRVSIRPRIFVYAKQPQTTVVRPAAVDRRSVADTQLNWNGHNPSACVAQCQELGAKT